MTAIKERNIALMMAICMGISNLLLIIKICTTNQRIVVVPAYQQQSFWLDQAQVSSEYLEQMTLFFLENMLNLTADSIAYQRDVILKHVNPGFYGELKKRFIEEEIRYKKESLATNIKPMKIVVDESSKTTTVVGVFTSFVAGKQVKQTKDSYQLQFIYEHGRLLINSFKLIASEEHV
jgi:conjugal transfer pilus assembly protein TraE